MIRFTNAVRFSVGLGILSLLGVLASMLALTDIYHGEQDVTQEWRALQISFGIIIAFHLAALVILGQVVRRVRRHGHTAG